MTVDSYLTVASILSGFGVTVLMFRIQRELYVREKHPELPTWLAWADYLIVAAVVLSLLLVVLPLIVLGDGSRVLAIATGSCAAAAILVAAYPFAILDHYRIEIGAHRKGGRAKGEPIEKAIVICASAVAAATFGGLVATRW
jgi:peptidoglycan biosynthesis protein MviN/MurJ (putative lipid II flippase)